MTSDDRPPTGTPDEGGASPAEGGGTPAPVDLSEDRENRWSWGMFVAGPVIWFSHFMFVYLLAEAGCTGGGHGLTIFDPPVPVVATLVSTVIAVVVAGGAAGWAYRHWQGSMRELRRAPDDADDLAGEFDDDRRRGTLAFAGFVLSTFSVAAILFTGAPALVLGPC